MGSIVSLLYNYFSGILRAVGDSKRPFYFLVVSSVLNLILDLVFILVFDMGIAGAAWATIISQGVSALLSALWLFRKTNVFTAENSGRRIKQVSVKHMQKLLAMVFLWR